MDKSKTNVKEKKCKEKNIKFWKKLSLISQITWSYLHSRWYNTIHKNVTNCFIYCLLQQSFPLWSVISSRVFDHTHNPQVTTILVTPITFSTKNTKVRPFTHPYIHVYTKAHTNATTLLIVPDTSNKPLWQEVWPWMTMT